MKNIFVAAALVFVFNAKAEIQAGAEAKSYTPPSETTVAKNRACFQELEVQGCRTLDEDHEQFRSCLSDVHQNLDEHCKKMMLELYGTKN